MITEELEQKVVQDKVDSTQDKEWKSYEKIIFRTAFFFFLILSLPLENFVDWIQRIAAIDFLNVNYRDLYDIAGYRPSFIKINTESGRWGIASYATWPIALGLSIVGAALWTIVVKIRKSERKEYNTAYYWLRVVVRYRIAVGIIAFGYVKLFPTQMPYPSEAVLDTILGDIQEQKIYWYSVGITLWYQVFLGFVEIFAGALLFFRRTTALGAALVAVVLFNIAFANHSYDGGVHVYSAYFVLLSLFVLWYDFPRIWNLLFNEKDVTPVHHDPIYSTPWKKYLFKSIKYAIIVIYVPYFFYIRAMGYWVENDPIQKEPTQPGLTNAQGLYAVTEFRLNNKTIPYSPLDSLRWQSVTFEKWSTITFKVNKPVKIDSGNGGPAKKDIDKNFELSGIAGGRRFFYYEIDSLKQTLILQDKNKPYNEGAYATREDKEKAKKAREKGLNKYIWHYQRPSATRIVLTGKDDNGREFYAVLDKIDKKYPLKDDRRQTAVY